MLGRAGNIAMGALFPHKRLAGAVGEQIQRGGQAVMDLPGQVTEALGTSGTHYRQLYRGADVALGDILPDVAAPDPEAKAKYEQAAIEAAATAAGGAIGHFAWQPISAVAKYLGRGARPAWKAEQMLTAAGKHVVPAGAERAASIGSELSKAALAGTAVDVAPEITPGPDVAHEWLEDVAAAGTGLGYLGVRGTENLMVGNPAYRARVMSPAGSSGVATVLGSLAGLAAAQGLPWLRQFLSDIMADTEEPPGPQAGASDIHGPLGPRRPSDQFDEQRHLAQRLLA